MTKEERKEYMKVYNKNYRLKNRDKLNKASEEWNKKNAEYRKKYMDDYLEKHREERRAYDRKHYQENKDRIKKQKLAHYHKNKILFIDEFGDRAIEKMAEKLNRVHRGNAINIIRG